MNYAYKQMGKKFTKVVVVILMNHILINMHIFYNMFINVLIGLVSLNKNTELKLQCTNLIMEYLKKLSVVKEFRENTLNK